MGSFIQRAVTLTVAMAGGVWVWAMANKLSSEQMTMISIAAIVGLPLCAVLVVMVAKADADRRMDHIERLEIEKTRRKRQGEYAPPVIVIGTQQPQLQAPPVVHNHMPPTNVTVQTAVLPDGRTATRGQGERAFKVVGEKELSQVETRRLRG